MNGSAEKIEMSNDKPIIEFIKKLDFVQKANFIRDWDEFQITKVIPQRALFIVKDFLKVMYGLENETYTVFWFNELYITICRNFADSFVEGVENNNFDILLNRLYKKFGYDIQI